MLSDCSNLSVALQDYWVLKYRISPNFSVNDMLRHVAAALTSFQQHDLVVLAEIHEAVDTFSELHHILDGLSDLYGTELPHYLSRLYRTGREDLQNI